MRKYFPWLLCLLCTGCWIAGCVKSSEPENATTVSTNDEPAAKSPEGTQPGPAPLITDDEPPLAEGEHDWVYLSPMKMKMRGMWLSAGEIVQSIENNTGLDYDKLETNAHNIVITAQEFAEFWEACRDHNRELALRAKAGEWFEAMYESQRVFKSCTDCHVTNWSLRTRGFAPESVDGWLKNGNSVEDVPYAQMRLFSPPGFLSIMFRMSAQLDRAVTGVESHSAKIVMDATKDIHTLVNEQAQYWRSIERYAKLIEEEASRNDALNVQKFYGRMTENCRACHEKYVNDDRAPLNPVPYTYRESARTDNE